MAVGVGKIKLHNLDAVDDTSPTTTHEGGAQPGFTASVTATNHRDLMSTHR